MIGIALAVAMQVAGAAYATMPGVDSVPRDVLADSLRTAETRFLMSWRREWMLNRFPRHTYQRLASLHCHHDDSWNFGAPNIIRSQHSSRSFCPVWFPVDDSLATDESEGIDASLPAEARPRLQKMRADLMERFVAAARERPAHPWIAGQLVRLAVDQGDGALALRAARECTASPSWCLLLEGYALHSLQREAAADSAFLRAISRMPAAERCEWTSIALLLDERSRAAYERIECAARDSIDATFWWLADPLYMEPGNARRAEHYYRKMVVRLHAALTMDERWDWKPRNGGDALATMIVRYGWPSYLHWAGLREDGGHFEWLGFRDSAVNVAPEYALPRFRTTPPWRAVLDPSALAAKDWEAFAPRRGYGSLEWESDGWPVEHWARRAGPIVELPGQMVVFRRDSDALLAVGMDVPQRFFTPGARIPYDAAIVAARDPTERWVPSRESIILDGQGTTVLVSPLSPRAQVISAELAPADGAPGLAARSRRAIHPPPPLSALPAGDIAISDPLFFRPDDNSLPPTDADAAIPRMLGALVASDKIGVFWETYGVAPNDTVTLRVTLSRSDKPNLLRRIGAAIGVASGDRGEFGVNWTEPRSGRREGSSWAGDVPIQGRSVVVDVSRLQEGRYQLVVSVARPNGQPAMTSREITISR